MCVISSSLRTLQRGIDRAPECPGSGPRSLATVGDPSALGDDDRTGGGHRQATPSGQPPSVQPDHGQTEGDQQERSFEQLHRGRAGARQRLCRRRTEDLRRHGRPGDGLSENHGRCLGHAPGRGRGGLPRLLLGLLVLLGLVLVLGFVFVLGLVLLGLVVLALVLVALVVVLGLGGVLVALVLGRVLAQGLAGVLALGRVIFSRCLDIVARAATGARARAGAGAVALVLGGALALALGLALAVVLVLAGALALALAGARAVAMAGRRCRCDAGQAPYTE